MKILRFATIVVGICCLALGGALAVAQEAKEAPVTGIPAAGDSVAVEKVVGRTRPVSESLLPASTKAWLSIPDARRLLDDFNATSVGQLAEMEEMKPFVDMITQKVRGLLDDKNVRLGITLDDIRDVRTGEICFAGVLATSADLAGKPARDAHGILILIDVDGNLPAAEKMLEKIGGEMKALGATEEVIDPILETAVTKWNVPKVSNPNLKFNTFQTICEGWLIATDNPSVLRDVILRIKNPGSDQMLGRLESEPSFAAIHKRVAVEDMDADIRWFVEPFGYIELAQSIADQEKTLRSRRDDVAGKLRVQGFDMLRGVGGMVAVNEGQHDVVHRTFAFTAANKITDEKRKRAKGIFDFQNQWGHDLTPEGFVSNDANSHLTLTWNMLSAYDNIGPVVDMFGGEGFFQDLETSFKNSDAQINLRDLVASMGNRISVVSSTQKPIDVRSEQVAVVVPLQEGILSHSQFFEKLKALIGSDGDVLQVGDLEYVLVETAKEDEDLDFDFDPRFGSLDDPAADEAVEEEGHEFFLFEKRFITVAKGRLIVANSLEAMQAMAANDATESLRDAADYAAVESAMSPFVDWSRVSARQFGRIDRQLEVNYEMLRRGEMVGAQTALARVLNELFRSEDDPADKVREQKIDATTLPAEYHSVVAPMLGLSGWAMETQEDGWLLSGTIVKKKLSGEMVQKDTEQTRR